MVMDVLKNRNVMNTAGELHLGISGEAKVDECMTLSGKLSEQTAAEDVMSEKKVFLLNTIARVQRQYLQAEDRKVVFRDLLESVLDLMDSEYGFIGEVKYEEDGTMYLQTHAITNIAWNAATRDLYKETEEEGLKFYNMKSLFGHVMTSSKAVISNDPANDKRVCGVPEGHPPLNSFLGVPFFMKGGEMNGMVGLANRPGGFSKSDIDFLEPFSVTCGNLIQAYWQVQRNNELINSLEEKVKERTRELELLNESLEEANRRLVKASAAQLQHFACMSHEIRTPLNCIIGLSSLLQETKLTPMQEESVRMIVTSGDLLLTVVNDVLDYSKLSSGNVDIEYKRSSLQDTLNSIVNSIEMKSISKSLTVRTFYDPALPEYVLTDSRRLQQILYNLLGNAVKFSHEGGVVEVTARLVTPGGTCPAAEKSQKSGEETSASESSGGGCPFRRNASSSSLTSLANFMDIQSKCPRHQSLSAADKLDGADRGRVLRLIVKDYGKGIEKKDFDRIFKPFLQASAETERVYGGTGLGLTITSKLVKALGGRISVESELGQWSKFIVDLPFRDEPVDIDRAAEKLSSSKVFVVDKGPSSTSDTFSNILHCYKADYVTFKSMHEMQTALDQDGVVKEDKSYVCLAHEDLFVDECYSALESRCKSVLITFGPKYNVKRSAAHFLSVTRVLPSVLIRSMSACLDSAATCEKKRPSRTNLSSRNTPLEILIAEDNLINQKVLSRMLLRLGIKEFDIANNGEKAVELEAGKKYDVVLMDMQMPVMDGLEACREILKRKGRPHPKIVFVTAHVSTSFRDECMVAGGSDFIAKPFNIGEIDACLQRMQALVHNGLHIDH